MGFLRNVALETLPSFPSPVRKNGILKVSNLVPVSLEPSGSRLQFSEVIGKPAPEVFPQQLLISQEGTF